MKLKLIAALACVLGGGLLVAGIAMIYPPAAFISAGAGLLAAGLLADLDRKPKAGR